MAYVSAYAEQLGKNELDIKNEASFIEDLGADSLDTVELVMSLEDAFQIEVPDEQQENLRTVQDVLDFIRSVAKA
ncbi:MAG: acyl carrier protein [Duodenibacillus sp.]|nr:acyl carrier protein [Duodenibacillus sp.]